MTYAGWIRDAVKVREDLIRQSDGSVITRSGCVIHIPERFLEKGLATLGENVSTIGILAICVANKYYATSTLNAMMRLSPTRISTVRVNEVSYLEFAFDPGAIVFVETQVVKIDTIIYRIFDEIIAKGRVPWYLGYNDLAKLFETADKFAGVGLSRSHAILEMIAAAICRAPKDRTLYYRQIVKSQEDLTRTPPVTIPLRSISYGATNTTSKLMGSYWADGMASALVNPSDKVEKIEELLRR